MSPVELTSLVRAMNDAFNRRDWWKWATHLHEDVVVETVLPADGPIVGREAYLRAAAAAANQWFDADLIEVEAWDDAYAYVCASVRLPAGNRGFKQQTVHWLMRFENERLVHTYTGSSRDDLARLHQRLRTEPAGRGASPER